MKPRYLQIGSGQPLGHGEASTGGEGVDTCTRPAPRGLVGRRVVKDGVGTWEALLAGFVTLGDVGRHNRVAGQQGFGRVHSSCEAG
jgi:hypothetical protein